MIRRAVLAALVAFLAGCATSEPVPDPAVAYPDALAATERDLLGAVEAVAAASGYDGLRTAVRGAAGVAAGARSRLAAAVPPAAAQALHPRLVAGLGAYAVSLESLADEVDHRVTCAASAVLEDLGADPAAAELRAVGRELAEAVPGLPGSGFVPEPGAAPSRRHANGSLVLAPPAGGAGRFEVRNQRAVDVVVTLARADEPVLAIAVSAGQTAATDGVPDGTYRIYVAGGTDVDTTGEFTRDCTFERLDAEQAFTTTADATSVVTLDLQVADGNVAAWEVPPDAYPR